MEAVRFRDALAAVQALMDSGTTAGAAMAAVLAAVRARLGADSPSERGIIRTAHYLSERGMLDNLIRVESFGMLATGQEDTIGRAVLYVKGATEAQRAFRSSDLTWPHSHIVFVDLCCPEDVSYILAEIAELREVYNASPRVVYPPNAARLEMVLLASAVELGLVAGL